MKHLFVFSTLMFLSSLSLSAQKMDNSKLGKIIEKYSETVEGDNGRWTFVIGEIPMICLTDETHNRMRIMSPVAELDKLEKEQVVEILEANFHSALDVRYAVSEGVVWVAYIHPLKELTDEQAVDAIRQVYNGVVTFGTSYSSTELTFPGGKEEEKETNKKKDKKGTSRS